MRVQEETEFAQVRRLPDGIAEYGCDASREEPDSRFQHVSQPLSPCARWPSACPAARAGLRSRYRRLHKRGAHSSQSHIDRGGCEVLLFENEPVPKDDGSVKCQTRFGTVPPYKFVDGVTVGFLRTGCAERVQNRILRLLQTASRSIVLALKRFDVSDAP